MVEREIEGRSLPESGVEFLFDTSNVPTPPVMLEYYLRRRISPGSVSVFQFTPTLVKIPLDLRPGGTPRLTDWLVQLVDRVEDDPGRRRILTRMTRYLNVFQSASGVGDRSPYKSLRSQRASVLFYNQLLAASIDNFTEPARALDRGAQIIGDFVEQRRDPYSFGRGQADIGTEQHIVGVASSIKATLQSESEDLLTLANWGPKVFYSLPKLFRERGKPPGRGETRVSEYVGVERSLGRLRILEGQKVRIVIVGPPHSGKTSLTLSLNNEINRLLGEAKDLSEFTDLKASCGVVDLDKSTPDAARILNGGDTGRVKATWSLPLAHEAARGFLDQETSIVLADAPGGDPDEITRLVTAPADLGIFLIAAESDNEWESSRDKWRRALRSVGVKPVVQIRSRRDGELNEVTGDQIQSTITTFSWSKWEGLPEKSWIVRVGGRVIGLKGEVKMNDPFIDLLAKVILFDLAPAVVVERNIRNQSYIEQVIADYSTAL